MHNNNFHSVNLTLWLSYFKEKFTLLITVKQWDLILHMIVFVGDRTFSLKPTLFTLWPWPWSLAYFLKTFIMLITISIVSAWALIFHMNFLVIRSVCLHFTFDQLKKWCWSLLLNDNIRVFILHMIISFDRFFVLVSKYFSLWS